MTIFNSKKKGKYCEMQMEHKLLQKILAECLLPKDGGVDQPSLEHRVFLQSHVVGIEGRPGQQQKFHSLWKITVRNLSSRRNFEGSQAVKDCY